MMWLAFFRTKTTACRVLTHLGLILIAVALSSSPLHALSPQEVAAHWSRIESDVKTGHKERAYKRLRWLLFTDTDHPERGSGYQIAMTRLRQDKPLTFGATAAVSPTTNLERASSQRYFYTDGNVYYLGEPGTDHSGLGLNLTFSTTASRAYAPGRELSIGIDLSGNLYSDRDLSSGFVRLRLSHEWLNSGTTYGITVFRDMASFADQDTDDDTSPSLDWTGLGVSWNAVRRLASGDTLRISLTTSTRDSVAEYYDYRDGPTTSLSASYTHVLQVKSYVTLLTSVESADLERESLSYRAVKLGGRYGRSTASGLSWELGFAKTFRTYDDRFTALSFAREDQVDEVSVGLSHDKIKLKDLSPMLSCTARDHGSNVALYDYNAVDCSLSFRRNF